MHAVVCELAASRYDRAVHGLVSPQVAAVVCVVAWACGWGGRVGGVGVWAGAGRGGGWRWRWKWRWFWLGCGGECDCGWVEEAWAAIYAFS